ncbi:hypothetical protein GCM10010347_40150 [Streptomyces cirratus]|uniref:Uncharacterized protein n=1 Tax=Streptomyces cirratus TaxID=68187 RepID=A0ABQ3EVK3_9ACTN|nr:hypothetical protein GCM10010347_40150 [Streptomyces cirratus]
MASMTIHNTTAATIVQMPSAIDSRKLTFITDHGSAFATRSRALRVRGAVRTPVRACRCATGPADAAYACGGVCGWAPGSWPAPPAFGFGFGPRVSVTVFPLPFAGASPP